MLQSERLIFREIRDTDFLSVAEIMRDEGVQKVWEHYFSDQDVQDWINRRKKGYQDNGIDYLLAVRKDTNEAVGQIGLLKETIGDKEIWGIGYILLSRFCGN